MNKLCKVGGAGIAIPVKWLVIVVQWLMTMVKNLRPTMSLEDTSDARDEHIKAGSLS